MNHMEMKWSRRRTKKEKETEKKKRKKRISGALQRRQPSKNGRVEE